MLWKTAALLAADIRDDRRGPRPEGRRAESPPRQGRARRQAGRQARAEPFFDARDPAMMVRCWRRPAPRPRSPTRKPTPSSCRSPQRRSSFTTQFAGCDAQGRKCAVALFDSATVGAQSDAGADQFVSTRPRPCAAATRTRPARPTSSIRRCCSRTTAATASPAARRLARLPRRVPRLHRRPGRLPRRSRPLGRRLRPSRRAATRSIEASASAMIRAHDLGGRQDVVHAARRLAHGEAGAVGVEALDLAADAAHDAGAVRDPRLHREGLDVLRPASPSPRRRGSSSPASACRNRSGCGWCPRPSPRRSCRGTSGRRGPRRLAMKRVPIQTPTAPRLSAAARPRPS